MFVFELFHIILFVSVIVNDEIVNFYEGQLKVLMLKQKVSADRLFQSALVDYSVKVSIAIFIPSLSAYSKMAASARLTYSSQLLATVA